MSVSSVKVNSKQKSDNVNHPAHYTYSAVEVADALDAWQLPWTLANVVKYVARHKYKGNPVEDLKKARWYLDRELAKYETGS